VAIFVAFHPLIEFNVLFICGGVELNERVTFKRNSIFQPLACSHLGFNRIIGNDNDIYIDAAAPLYANSRVPVDSVCQIATCRVAQSHADCVNEESLE